MAHVLTCRFMLVPYCCCSADIPMLVAGDFNSVPGSAAHSLLVKGRVEPQQLVRNKQQRS
jgi:endonuclease/exonuclease/phosphatase family metal-dependent hydrolase